MSVAQQLRPTRPSHLLPDAREFVLPEGIVSSGFPAVRETCKKIGIVFDKWQQDLNTCILAKDGDGFYAADVVLLSICRQAGKTFDVGALVFADCIINPGTTVVWTAHRFKVARETFNELKALAQSALLKPYIDADKITTAAGNESIPFRNGSRIVFAARERGSIRGFTKVRRLILDEGQILTEAAMADLAPVLQHGINPQVIIMGTPPKPGDPGEVFSEMRRQALEGESEGMLFVEFSADPEVTDINLKDPEFWKQMLKANPAYACGRTKRRAIVQLRKLIPNDEDFRREAMGIWDDSQKMPVFGRGKWERLTKRPRPENARLSVIGVAVSIDLMSASIVAGAEVEDLPAIRVLKTGRDYEEWLVDKAVELSEYHGSPVLIDGRGPGADLVPLLQERLGRDLYVLKTSEVLDACATIYKKVVAGDMIRLVDDVIAERPDELMLYKDELDFAVQEAVKRDVGDRWAWGRRKSEVDISSLEAATLVVWGLTNPEIVDPPSAYTDSGLMVI